MVYSLLFSFIFWQKYLNWFHDIHPQRFFLFIIIYLIMFVYFLGECYICGNVKL